MSDKVLCTETTKKTGQPCGAFASATGYCFFHGNPDRAAELGREGGRRNRHFVETPLAPLPAITSDDDVRVAVIQVIDEVRAGRMDPGTGKVIILSFHSVLRTLAETELGEVRKTLEELRKRQAQVLGSIDKPDGWGSPRANGFSERDQTAPTL